MLSVHRGCKNKAESFQYFQNNCLTSNNSALLRTAYHHDFYLNLELKTNPSPHTSVVKPESQFNELKTML